MAEWCYRNWVLLWHFNWGIMPNHLSGSHWHGPEDRRTQKSWPRYYTLKSRTWLVSRETYRYPCTLPFLPSDSEHLKLLSVNLKFNDFANQNFIGMFWAGQNQAYSLQRSPSNFLFYVDFNTTVTPRIQYVSITVFSASKRNYFCWWEKELTEKIEFPGRLKSTGG
jgi:hypothetical protein